MLSRMAYKSREEIANSVDEFVNRNKWQIAVRFYVIETNILRLQE